MSCANIPSWIVALVLSGCITFVISDFFIIGKSNTIDSESMFRRHSFYVSMEHYYKNEYADKITDTEQLQPVLDEMNNISADLDAGLDQRLPFDFGCVCYSILFFYIVSVIVKGRTRMGAAIPHKWPN